MTKLFGRTYQVLNEILLDKQAFISNVHYFQKLHHTPVAPVLKANAYGHGLLPIASLADSLHAPCLCVDSLFEAYQLQKAHIKTPILILGYTFPENYHTLRSLPFTFSVHDTDTLAALAKYQPHAKIHLKLDTGMCRLGIQPHQVNDWIKILKHYPKLKLEGIFSHLSQADDRKKDAFSRNQITLFKQMVAQFEAAGFSFKFKHIAATAAAHWLDDSYFSFSRIGLGMYGYSPFKTPALKPVLTFISHLASVKTIPSQSQVGYGGTYHTKTTQDIGVIPAGYAEGINRNLSNQGSVIINRTPCPIVGNVCMDMTMVKLTTKCNVGDQVILISPDITAPNNVYRLAEIEHTIPYTILTGLHPTIRRTIHD